MGSWFVGALAYADDIVLMAPTATAVRRMRRQSLIGQINTVLCRFGRLYPTVKNRLFQAY